MSQLHEILEEFIRQVDKAYLAFSKAESDGGSEADMVLAKQIKENRSFRHILLMHSLCVNGIYSVEDALQKLYQRKEL